MQPKVAAEIIGALKEAGVDFVTTLTEANLHELVMGLALALPHRKQVHLRPLRREVGKGHDPDRAALPGRHSQKELKQGWIGPCETAPGFVETTLFLCHRSFLIQI